MISDLHGVIVCFMLDDTPKCNGLSDSSVVFTCVDSNMTLRTICSFQTVCPDVAVGVVAVDPLKARLSLATMPAPHNIHVIQAKQHFESWNPTQVHC